MNTVSPDPSSALLANLPGLLPNLEALYKDIHAHPELSMQENRTADLAAKHLRTMAMSDHGRGQDGCRRTASQRRRPDGHAARRHGCAARPEASGVDMPAASPRRMPGKTVPVAHACGHDMHVAWLTGVDALFAQAPRRPGAAR